MVNEFEKFFGVSLDLLCIAGTDGFFRKINPAFHRVLGWSEQELLARPFLDFVHPDDQANTLAEIEKLSQGLPTVSFRNRYRKLNGGYVSLIWNAFPEKEIGLVYAVARDVTESERLQDRFRLAIDSAPAAMIMTDHSGCIELINKEAEALFGYTQDELLGREVEILLPDKSRSAHRKMRADFVHQPSVRIMNAREGLQARRRDGVVIPVEIALNPVMTEEGVHVLSVILDLRPREEVDLLKRKFIAGMSHELRTPLTSINGSLLLLKGGVAGPLPDKAAELVQLASQNCDRLVTMLNELLDIEKMRTGKMTVELRRQDLRTAAEHACLQNKPLALANGVFIRFTCGEESCPVLADADRLIQVFTNLISNAIKFSPEGATVLVRVLRAKDRFFRVEIEDSGPGIPEAFRQRIFETFEQVPDHRPRMKGGSGLGLSIAKALVEQHGGRIGFETETGRGSVFYFELPMA